MHIDLPQILPLVWSSAMPALRKLPVCIVNVRQKFKLRTVCS